MASSSERGRCGSVQSSEPLDPRIKVELEILNQCASDVNRLEREVDEARNKYQQNFSTSSQELERLKKKYKESIKKARPYYELKEKAIEAQSEALRSARKFQSANGVYLAAKETISLAELRLMDDKAASLSAAWQEMLNHALLKVMEAERQKSASEKEHLARAAAFGEIEQQMIVHEKRQKRSIAKARVYFDTKKELEIKLQQVKQSIQDLQQAMASAKKRYSGALRRLEVISDALHEERKEELVLMFPREPGVGAEDDKWIEQKLPTLSTCDVDEIDRSKDGDESESCEDDGGDDDYDDDECNSIDSDSVFRARVLTTALDDEDTSFVKSKKGKSKQLKRSQSLPVNASELARRQKTLPRPSPLSDRAEVSPPDGESIGSNTSGSTTFAATLSQHETPTENGAPSNAINEGASTSSNLDSLTSTDNPATENLHISHDADPQPSCSHSSNPKNNVECTPDVTVNNAMNKETSTLLTLDPVTLTNNEPVDNVEVSQDSEG